MLSAVRTTALLLQHMLHDSLHSQTSIFGMMITKLILEENLDENLDGIVDVNVIIKIQY